MPALTSYALLAVSKAAQTRKSYGTDIAVGDKTFRVITRPLKRAENELLPEGAVNAAAADLRVFNASPADFPVPPAIETRLMWAGNEYSVIFSVLGDPISGTFASLKIYAYRTPADDAVTTETPEEAAASGEPQSAGKRKTYSPAPSTL